MKCKDAIKSYVNTLPSASTREVAGRELRLINTFKPLLSWSQADSISYMRHIQKTLQPSSVNTRMNRIRLFFEFHIDEGNYKKPNPVIKKMIPKFRDEKEPQVLTKDEVKLFLKKIPKGTWLGMRDRCAVGLQLIHGFRISTVLSMDWDHLEKRGADWYIYTKGKGCVTGARRLRPDMVAQLSKFHQQTFGVPLI